MCVCVQITNNINIITICQKPKTIWKLFLNYTIEIIYRHVYLFIKPNINIYTHIFSVHENSYSLSKIMNNIHVISISKYMRYDEGNNALYNIISIWYKYTIIHLYIIYYTYIYI